MNKFIIFILAVLIMNMAFTAHNVAKAEKLGKEEALAIATDAYIYGYSLITTEVTRVQMSNVPKVEGLKSPTGQFLNIQRYPSVDERRITAPNADTLYSIVWIDLAEPQVFSQPEIANRFFIMEMVDLWMGILADSPSVLINDGKAGNYLLTGPGWKGDVPEGMKHIPVETRYVCILGRTYADGTEQDFQIVNGIQDHLKITPLSAWGTDYAPKAPPVNPNPGFSMDDKPAEVILDMSTEDYFNMMARLMGGEAPPTKEDGPILARMARIGLVPGQPFDMSKLDPAVQEALEDLPKEAFGKLEATYKTFGKSVNGWRLVLGLGEWGTDYLKRATVAAFGWPSNYQDVAVYPYADVDSNGDVLTGANKYTVTFAKGQEPPVHEHGFWSITMYEIDNGWWFYPNPLNKLTVSQRNKFKQNADGSVTLYFQHESPGADLQENWLPAPKGPFILMLRMYWPKEGDPSILNGTWTPPTVQLVP